MAYYPAFKDLLTPMETIEMACMDISYDKQVYMFTWNPAPKFYEYDKLGNNQYKKQWLKMLNLLKKINRCSKCYCIVPEISDDGKLHCHGWFRLDDRIKWLKSVRRAIVANGFMKINKLYVPIEKIDYYYKEVYDTQEVLQEVFCVLTHFNIEEIMRQCWLYVENLIGRYKASEKKYAFRFLEWAKDDNDFDVNGQDIEDSLISIDFAADIKEI